MANTQELKEAIRARNVFLGRATQFIEEVCNSGREERHLYAIGSSSSGQAAAYVKGLEGFTFLVARAVDEGKLYRVWYHPGPSAVISTGLERTEAQLTVIRRTGTKGWPDGFQVLEFVGNLAWQQDLDHLIEHKEERLREFDQRRREEVAAKEERKRLEAPCRALHEEAQRLRLE